MAIIGLAPAAHGANRTGRMFTGDQSGDWLYRALYDAGIASQAHSIDAADGLALRDCRIIAPVHCAPPDNWPRPDEKRTCAIWFDDELARLTTLHAAMCLGQIAWTSTLAAARRLGCQVPAPLRVSATALALNSSDPMELPSSCWGATTSAVRTRIPDVSLVTCLTTPSARFWI